ncbi:hypothetical protein RHMOL_Rhmol08G0304500 [Rhododendron molle]|uniref:Uncharacterized protein n=1 Tax=Rhododendron molle TaxID=49168 RepID=A0ACC0MUD1_RHOML|nr:hypothetical protein RHMOL_Rhmol08G0304500 [Rhododendron molle]
MDYDSANINSLPRELLVNVLDRVASFTFTDLFNSKLWLNISLARIRNQGFENLRRATEKGHAEATYVYGILLLCMGGEPIVHGLNLLNTMEKINTSSSKSGGRGFNIFQECWEKIKSIFGSMWINNHVVDRRISSCRHPKEVVTVFETWEGRFEVVTMVRGVSYANGMEK